MSGTEPPASPPADDGPPAAAEPRWDLGDALSYGWARFQADLGQILLAAVALFGALLVAGGIAAWLQTTLLDQASVAYDEDTGRFEPTDGSGLPATLLVAGLTVAVVLLLVQVVAAGVIRGALAITEGRPFDLAEVFRTDRLGAVVVTSLIVALGSALGSALCYLPGLVVMFATSYSLYFVLDKDLSPLEAITASVTLVRDNPANTLAWFLVGGLVAAGGALLCGVGLILTVPTVLIGTAYTYRTLTGRPVAGPPLADPPAPA